MALCCPIAVCILRLVILASLIYFNDELLIFTHFTLYNLGFWTIVVVTIVIYLFASLQDPGFVKVCPSQLCLSKGKRSRRPRTPSGARGTDEDEVTEHSALQRAAEYYSESEVEDDQSIHEIESMELHRKRHGSRQRFKFREHRPEPIDFGTSDDSSDSFEQYLSSSVSSFESSSNSGNVSGVSSVNDDDWDDDDEKWRRDQVALSGDSSTADARKLSAEGSQTIASLEDPPNSEGGFTSSRLAPENGGTVGDSDPYRIPIDSCESEGDMDFGRQRLTERPPQVELHVIGVDGVKRRAAASRCQFHVTTAASCGENVKDKRRIAARRGRGGGTAEGAILDAVANTCGVEAVFGVAKQMNHAGCCQEIYSRVFEAQKYRLYQCGSELRFCEKCQLYQPLRAKHCSDCKRCVRTHDHHCPWLGTCVGERNRCLFYWYLLFQTIELAWAITEGIFIISNQRLSRIVFEDSVGSLVLGLVWLLVAIALMTFFAIMTCCLFGYHTFLAVANLTTWENICWERISYLRSLQEQDGSPFSRGFRSNLAVFCCPSFMPEVFRKWTRQWNTVPCGENAELIWETGKQQAPGVISNKLFNCLG